MRFSVQGGAGRVHSIQRTMLTTLYETADILVVDKPCGLPSQPGEGVGANLVSAVERDFGFRPFLVHRLDRETSGCVLVAKSSQAAARWSSEFSGRQMGKTYRAVCAGAPEPPRGVYDDPLPPARGDHGDQGGQAATTSYRTLARFGPEPGFSYLELDLGTGRMHQIRRHLALHGHPILGDDRHGDFALNKALKKSTGLKRLLLWAWRLILPGGIEVISPVPPHLAAFLAAFPDAPAADAAPAAPAGRSAHAR